MNIYNVGMAIVIALLIGLLIALWNVTGNTVPKPRIELAQILDPEYKEIGNGIKRTDDLEKGVSCYIYYGSKLSCVKVNQ